MDIKQAVSSVDRFGGFIMIMIFLVGLICLCGMGYFLVKAKNPRSYPSKRVLQSNAFFMGVPGFFLLFMGNGPLSIGLG